jgi:glycosyltransferase involved in cell wall biosynthesis
MSEVHVTLSQSAVLVTKRILDQYSMSVISSISLFRGYVQDKRGSMRIYSDYLVNCLRAKLPGVPIHEVIPQVPKWLEGNYQAMRFFRYLIYPLQANQENSTINHITEAGYTHLLRCLDASKTVVTVHDLIPILSWRGLIPGLSYPHAPRLLEHSLSHLKKAAVVITPSECVKKDVIKYCECSETNVRVVYHGIDTRFRPYSRERRIQQRKKFGLPLRDYLILISGDQAYKNHTTCSQVLQRVRKVLCRDTRLVRVGRGAPFSIKAARGSPDDRSIVELGMLPPHVMPSVYNAVDALLFPSWYEGFGWPPLEAMACGIPVVVSNAGSIPELVADAGHICAPDDVVALSERIREVLEDIPARSSLIEKGLCRASQFTWERHAERLCNIYAEVASSHHGRHRTDRSMVKTL